MQSAAGADSLRVSVAGPNLASILRQTGGDESMSSFDTEKSRRLRLRNLYISERGHILKTFRKLLVLSLHDSTSDSGNSGGPNAARKLGVALFKEKSAGDGLKKFLEECIAGIRKRLKDVAASGGWLAASESNQETEATWKTTLVEEIVHILQLMFHQLHASTEVPSGILLESWLELMAEYDFLESLQVVSGDMIVTLWFLMLTRATAVRATQRGVTATPIICVADHLGLFESSPRGPMHPRKDKTSGDLFGTGGILPLEGKDS